MEMSAIRVKKDVLDSRRRRGKAERDGVREEERIHTSRHPCRLGNHAVIAG